MIPTALDMLRQARTALADAAAQLTERKAMMLSVPTIDHVSTVTALNTTRALKTELRRLVTEPCVELEDGRCVKQVQFEALETFAARNALPLKALLTSISIDQELVVRCAFVGKGITTLEGLKGLWSLKTLYLDDNTNLTSLEGVPTHALEELHASGCDLRGDLSALSGAVKLKQLAVLNNTCLSSLKGVPTRNIETIAAAYCGLVGDLSELKGAGKLKTLRMSGNGMLTSLKGIPTQEIKELDVAGCDIRGDFSDLSGATKLERLYANGNSLLSSLVGIPTQNIQVVDVSHCSLSGSLSPLSGAASLKKLRVTGNDHLVSLKSGTN